MRKLVAVVGAVVAQAQVESLVKQPVSRDT